jgi:small-conductance mechanosensitive channel
MWSPGALAMIDVIYLIAKVIAVTAMITNFVGLIFREIRHSGAIENIFVRRFLPIIRFLFVATIWIISIFYILDALNIDTRSILAWAWIGWAILALAGKDIMTNLFGSLSLLLSRTFDIGESIRIRMAWTKVYEWIVEEITLNYTKLTNISGEVIFIPNRLIYTEVVENLSRRRFFIYEYIVPFKKSGSNGHDVQEQLRIIEGKIDEYNPISIEWVTENPNAWDFLYRISVKLPDENDSFDRDIREFLTSYIFQSKETENSLQK